MNHFIEVFDNALSDEQCDICIDAVNQDSRSRIGVVNTEQGQIVDKKRKDDTELTLELQNQEPIHDIVCPILVQLGREYMNRQPALSQIASWTFAPYYNIQKYNPEQGFHMLHTENTDKTTANRILAWMFYLNTVTDGGGTYWHNYDLTINSVKGRLVIWPAYYTHFHQGVVSKTETKYNATGWFQYS